ncbi:hypothetical protein Taro_044402, partial [Colocasia esculenta]|nr:hypothetical protein [Colocasia esculenta]
MASKAKKLASCHRPSSSRAGNDDRATDERRTKHRDDRLPKLVVPPRLHLTHSQGSFLKFVQPSCNDEEALSSFLEREALVFCGCGHGPPGGELALPPSASPSSSPPASVHPSPMPSKSYARDLADAPLFAPVSIDVHPPAFTDLGEPTVFFSADEIAATLKPLQFAIVAKPPYGRPPFQEIKHLLQQRLNLGHDFIIAAMDNHHLLLRFSEGILGGFCRWLCGHLKLPIPLSARNILTNRQLEPAKNGSCQLELADRKMGCRFWLLRKIPFHLILLPYVVLIKGCTGRSLMFVDFFPLSARKILINRELESAKNGTCQLELADRKMGCHFWILRKIPFHLMLLPYVILIK